jgi:hypothetical protein
MIHLPPDFGLAWIASVFVALVATLVLDMAEADFVGTPKGTPPVIDRSKIACLLFLIVSVCIALWALTLFIVGIVAFMWVTTEGVKWIGRRQQLQARG